MFQNTPAEEINKQLAILKCRIKTDESNLIVKTDKNKNMIFAYLYSLKKADIIDIILSIDNSEFKEKRISTNSNHIGEELYVWTPIRTFTAQNGEERKIKLYIKTYIPENSSHIIVISFHEYGDYD